jgi:PAS domain S-box
MIKYLQSMHISFPHHFSNLMKRQLLPSLIGISIIGAGIAFSIMNYNVAVAEKRREIIAIGSLKANQIIAWRKEFQQDAVIMAKNQFLSEAIKRINADPLNKQLRFAMRTQLNAYPMYGDWEEVAIYDMSGKKIDGNDDKEVLDSESMTLASAAIADDAPEFKDIYKRLNGSYSLDVIVPIIDNTKQPLGVIIFRKDPSKQLFPLIQSWPIPSETAETLLVRREGQNVVWLNTLRFNNSAPLTVKFSINNQSIPAVAAVLGRTGAFNGRDYRGVSVLSDLRPIDGSPWFLVAKIDVREATTIASRLSIMIIAIAVAIAALWISGIVTNYHRKIGKTFRSLYTHEKKQSEILEEFHATLLGIGDGVISTDKDGIVRWMNKSAEQMTGWSNIEARGKALREVFQIVNQDTGKDLSAPIEDIIRTDDVIALSSLALLRSRDGVEKPIADSGAPIHRADGTIAGVVLVFHDVGIQRRAEAKAQWLSSIVESSLNEVIVFQPQTLRIVYANKCALDNLGYSLDELREMTPIQIKPEFSRERFIALLKPLRINSGSSLNIVTKNMRKDGSMYEVLFSIQILSSPDGPRFVSVGLDFSEQSVLEKQLKETIAERETLLREVHHRTKNNLQIVSSLISLESSNLSDTNLRSVLCDMEGRIETMAMAHELLYESKNLSHIELSSYLESILLLAIQSREINSRITTTVECDDISLALDSASPIGLVINELVTNSLKYAFPGERIGQIRILGDSNNDLLRLEYYDNGIGLPDGFIPGKQGHLGFTLIDSLIKKQLHGNFTIVKDQGFHCILDLAMPNIHVA